ncbi:hypothetical protein F4777DRAFT_358233 [Nemania sp. FL0916]|nr:hypothetical protein F4777DRAFT_358233 [Nemania sp. FL0916]
MTNLAMLNIKPGYEPWSACYDCFLALVVTLGSLAAVSAQWSPGRPPERGYLSLGDIVCCVFSNPLVSRRRKSA